MQSLEYLIARRTASSDSESRTSVMSRIATVTVALAMAAMILTLAVVQGFRRQIYADLKYTHDHWGYWGRCCYALGHG